MENTNIEWAHHTFNPWEGCTKVGPGCDNCYAEARNIRFKGGNWGAGAPRRRTSEANWKQPLKWNKKAGELGIRYRVFCASLADVFDNEVDSRWRADLFRLIRATPNLDWLLLTKRIGNASYMIKNARVEGHLLTSGSPEWPWKNVWLGATIVNQEEADRDIPKLLKIPARVHFLSMEPLLGPVNLTWTDNSDGMLVEKIYALDQVIVGGESGKNARPMRLDWVISLRDQCAEFRIPFLFKQWGEWSPSPSGMFRYGKKVSGRMLDGKTHTEFPAPA